MHNLVIISTSHKNFQFKTFYNNLILNKVQQLKFKHLN